MRELRYLRQAGFAIAAARSAPVTPNGSVARLIPLAAVAYIRDQVF